MFNEVIVFEILYFTSLACYQKFISRDQIFFDLFQDPDDLAVAIDRMAIENIVFPAPPVNLNWPAPPPTLTFDELEDIFLQAIQTLFENGVRSQHELMNHMNQVIQNERHKCADPKVLTLVEFFSTEDPENYCELLRKWLVNRTTTLNGQIRTLHSVSESVFQLCEKVVHIDYILKLMIDPS